MFRDVSGYFGIFLMFYDRYEVIHFSFAIHSVFMKNKPH